MATVTKSLPFDQWYAKANAICCTRLGVSLDDMPDCCYADWYEDGVTPKGAVSRAIRAAKGEGECY
jgi:hypothetical protein